MEIKIEDGDSNSGEVPVTKIEGKDRVEEGVDELFNKVRATIAALSEGCFYNECDRLHKYFEENPRFFIETYEEPGKVTYAFRPGVSELLDRMRAGASKIAGGPEVHEAFNKLVQFTLTGPDAGKMN